MLLLLLACHDDAAPAASPPSPYIFPEEDPPAPLLDEAAISAALDEALGAVLGVAAAPVIAGYDQAMTHQQPGCPDYYETDGSTYWYDDCATDDGTRFTGYGYAYVYDATDGGDGYLYTGSQLYMVADITTPEGWRYQGGGSASSLRLDHVGTGGDDVSHTLYYNVLQGAFAWDGPEADGTWLQSTLSPTLTVYAYVVPETEAWSGQLVYVDGGLDGLSGSASTVVFDEVQAVSASMGNTCLEEPIGTISVRDTEGGWYDVLFDNALPWEAGSASGDACDGCGTVWYRGEPIGSACTDISGLLDWEGSPW